MTSATLAGIVRQMPSTALAIPYDNNLRVDEMVREGVPAKTLRELARLLNIDIGRLAAAVRIPRRTLERRLSDAAALPFDEGDRAVRIGRLLAKATDVFNDSAEAAAWFTEPLDTLGGVAPLELCATDAGSRAVEQTLGRIEHGVFG